MYHIVKSNMKKHAYNKKVDTGNQLRICLRIYDYLEIVGVVAKAGQGSGKLAGRLLDPDVRPNQLYTFIFEYYVGCQLITGSVKI